MPEAAAEQSSNWALPLQCLLSYHQHSIQLRELYQLAHKSSHESIHSDDIDAILQSFNLRTQWQTYTWKQLKFCELPAIVQLHNGHGVTLISLNRQFAIIAVSNEGKIEEHQVSLDSLKKDFSGRVLQLQPQLQSSGATNRISLSEWIDRKSLGFTIFEVILASLMINLFQIALPLYTMNVYDKVIPNQAEETLWVLFSGILVILFLDYLFRIIRGVVLENLSERIGEALEVRLFRKSLTAKNELREVVGAEADTFHEVSNYRSGFFGKTLVDLIEIPFFFIFFFIIYALSETLAMIPLVAALVIIVLNLIHHFPLKRLGSSLFELRKHKEDFLIQAISGRDTLRLNNALPRFLQRWQANVRKSLSLARASSLWNNSMSTITPIVVQGVSVMVVFIGSYEVFAGNLTVGAMVAATILSARAILPILNFSNALTRLFSSRHMLMQWYRTLTRQSDFDVHENLINKGRFKGSLVLKDVRSKYPNSPRWIIDTINLQIAAGERVGLIGPSGAGKTSLLNLLAGLIKPNEGLLQMDSYDISDIHPFELHRSISFMPQNPAFFSESLRENIQLGSEVDHQRMQQLIEDFGLDKMIGQASLGASLTHKISERGENLSGGQRQLIALLRCLYVDACLYLFDEPTAGMDGQMESLVINYLQKKLHGKSIILVTHRPGLLQLVDRLIVMNSGKIVADGPRDIIVQKYFGQNNHLTEVPLKQAQVNFK